MNLLDNSRLKVRKLRKTESIKKTKTIAVAGNPNVGKSTLFNALTGLRQHTGNWPGKTVECAQGSYTYNNTNFKFVDIPGTYSLLSNSSEEEIARNFICFENPDAVVIVVDATCLERNLNLVIQILELTQKVVICVNLIDEAIKKKIHIDINELSIQLGVPVVTTNARNHRGLNNLMKTIQSLTDGTTKTFKIKTDYGEIINNATDKIKNTLKNNINLQLSYDWISLRLLENNSNLIDSLTHYIHENITENPEIQKEIKLQTKKLQIQNISISELREKIIRAIIKRSEKIYKLCVKTENRHYDNTDRKIDKFLTSGITGFPVMILMLLGVFWITIIGANYPSEIIASGLFILQDKMMELMIMCGAPSWLYGILILGIYRTLAWVVSVMLPPMAIFFPLFTLLEDVGYLPRIAFNLDNIFKKCGAHGKQSLTMSIGFGCNACGIIGCRIIDSPRERLIAILTNNFVPCNGRFPILISIITMFFVGEMCTSLQSLLKATILTGIIIFGILATFLISKLLSLSLLKGVPSSFILELPPYRKPQLKKILIRSVLDRTIFVLGRAVAVAAPAGLIIWIMANIKINDLSILSYSSNFLNPFAKLIGMDGTILTAFILGFPANEIVLPIIIMSYMCEGSMIEPGNLPDLGAFLVAHGWTYVTAICVMLFSLMHFPCGTTCWTIKKETGSLKWTVIACIVPTVLGIIVCFTACNLIKIIELLI